MVLSNKKLKQKLRSDLVESLTAKESEKQGNDAGKPESNLQQPQSLKELLGSVTQKPRLTKREIRRKKISLENPTPSDKDNNTQKENDEIGLMGSSNNKAQKKIKKRKMTDGPEEKIGDGGNESTADKSENGVKKEKEKNKKKEKKKKKKKKEKTKKEAENKEGESKVEGGPVELMKTEESMAPRNAKGKRPASSSSQFDVDRFRDAEGALRFESDFKDRTVIFERLVIQNSLTGSRFTRWLHQNYLMVLLDLQNECFDEWTREFYCNMFEVTEDGFRTFVRGKTLSVDAQKITTLLTLRRPAQPVYPLPNPDDPAIDMDIVASEICGRPTQWIPPVMKISGLTSDYRLLNTFVVHNIEPRGHSSDLLPSQAILLYYLGTSISVDIPRTILDCMLRIFNEPRKLQLPYGAMISKLLIAAGCHVYPHEVPITKRQKIDGRTRAMSDTHVRHRIQGEQAPINVEDADEDSIASRLLAVEHAIYDQSIQLEQLDEKITSGFNDIRTQLDNIFSQYRHQ